MERENAASVVNTFGNLPEGTTPGGQAVTTLYVDD